MWLLFLDYAGMAYTCVQSFIDIGDYMLFLVQKYAPNLQQICLKGL